MNAWDSVQATLDWIEDNLSEDIAIEKLTGIAHLSPFYFQRLFTRLVGKPVMEYIKLRRLARAADYLAENPGKVIDTALKFGFENHETFTRAFRNTYGITPGEYRKSPRPLSHFLVPQLSLQYHLVDENVPLVADGIVLEVWKMKLDMHRYFSGWTVQNPVSDTPGIDLLSELWNRLHQQKTTIRNLALPGYEAGVSSPGVTIETFSYFAGAETESESMQEGFTSWILPEGEYAVCSFIAENFYLLTTVALNTARDYMLQTWLPQHNLEIEPLMVELYEDTSPESTSMEVWFKIKPQK